jgi:hypothetical protein
MGDVKRAPASAAITHALPADAELDTGSTFAPQLPGWLAVEAGPADSCP